MTLMPATSSRKKKASSLSSLVLKVNTDEAYRAKFLKSPVEELKKYGIVLDEATARDVRAVAKDLRGKLPNLTNLPSGAAGALQGKGGNPDEYAMMCI